MSSQKIREAQDFLKKKFAEYYENDYALTSTSSVNVEQREFGFIPFNEKIMIRHKKFDTSKRLVGFLLSLTPSHAYYSSAYYVDPEASMDRKGWRGADLIFDIDADHINTPCKQRHEFWICDECQTPSIKASHGQRCSICGSSKMKQETWLCETCLAVVKSETIKLLDFLLVDFGFQPMNLDIRFSGHRGYHVIVQENKVKQLDQTARKEIVDYIRGTGLKVEFHGLTETLEKRQRRMIGPDFKEPGWRGRMARGIYDFLVSADSSQLRAIKLNEVKRDSILQIWSERKPWGIKDIGLETWIELANHGIQSQTSMIDTVVTTDLHRLIRIPETLHGKTGLRVKKIPLNSLEKFNPCFDAIAFHEGMIDVFIQESHELHLNNQNFGPFREEKVQLPMAVGIYLLCKKVATLGE